ncbi:MAG TPA: MATE family efflux transporter [Euryarchaeota archaeon]|nr:MATE family efflux transporter [Euryarchaeota archaeon]
MRSVSKEQILKGPIIKTLFLLGWPIMISSLLETAYTLADTFWLGRLEESKYAVAALQISWPIIFLLISIAFGLGAAGVALVSQYTGAKKHEEAERSAGQVIFISLTFGLVFAITGFFLSPFIVHSLGLEKEVSHLAILYLRIIFFGMPFMFESFMFGFIMRAYGDTVTPMIVSGVAVILNIALDPILIFGMFGFPRMGVLGAGLATILTQSLATGIALYLLFKGKVGIKLKLSYLKPEKEKIKKIFRIGIPASIGNSGTAFGFFILMYILARVPDSTVVLAAYGIGDRIINLIFISINGLSAGITTVLGQSLGADKIERAEETVKKGILAMFFILVVCSILLVLFRTEIMKIFINNSDVVNEGANLIKCVMIGVPFFGIFSGIVASFQGSGHNVPTMILDISRLWALRIPLAYFLGLYLGMNSTGVWIGMALSNIVGTAIALIFFKTGIWKKKVID